MTSVTKRTRYFARFLSPGLIVGNEWEVELASGDPQRVHWPDSAYAFTLHKRDDVTVDGIDYQGKQVQLGPLYYHPHSKIETLEKVKANPNATPVLIDNMRCNGWTSVIWTRWGTWPQPFDADQMQVLQEGGAS